MTHLNQTIANPSKGILFEYQEAIPTVFEIRLETGFCIYFHIELIRISHYNCLSVRFLDPRVNDTAKICLEQTVAKLSLTIFDIIQKYQTADIILFHPDNIRLFIGFKETALFTAIGSRLANLKLIQQPKDLISTLLPYPVKYAPMKTEISRMSDIELTNIVLQVI